MKFDYVLIDFYGGTHGNFLEFVLNKYILEIESANFTPFTETGTSHIKTLAYNEDKRFICNHYSFNDVEIPAGNNAVIQILSDKYSIYNSVLRAGDVPLDIKNLEYNTLEKLTHKKNHPYAQDIVRQMGERVDYPRSRLRNIFYAKFNEQKELKKLQNFKDHGLPTFEFPVSSLNDFNNFVNYIGKISIFVGKIGWEYKVNLYDLWSQFINKNYGFHSFNKCNKIIKNILTATDSNFECDLIEEAYINSYITDAFNIHDDITFEMDIYPNNTKDIYYLIMDKIKKQRLPT